MDTAFKRLAKNYKDGMDSRETALYADLATDREKTKVA